MKEMLMTIEFIKSISRRIYGKDIFFYDFDEMKWYSRLDCCYVTYEHILEWLEENIQYD